MTNWQARVKVKHLLTKDEDHESTQATMNAIADVLSREVCFAGFSIGGFRSIPECDDVFKPVDYANKLLERMYDFADSHQIWIE